MDRNWRLNRLNSAVTQSLKINRLAGFGNLWEKSGVLSIFKVFYCLCLATCSCIKALFHCSLCLRFGLRFRFFNTHGLWVATSFPCTDFTRSAACQESRKQSRRRFPLSPPPTTSASNQFTLRCWHSGERRRSLLNKKTWRPSFCSGTFVRIKEPFFTSSWTIEKKLARKTTVFFAQQSRDKPVVWSVQVQLWNTIRPSRMLRRQSAGYGYRRLAWCG